MKYTQKRVLFVPAIVFAIIALVFEWIAFMLFVEYNAEVGTAFEGSTVTDFLFYLVNLTSLVLLVPFLFIQKRTNKAYGLAIASFIINIISILLFFILQIQVYTDASIVSGDLKLVTAASTFVYQFLFNFAFAIMFLVFAILRFKAKVLKIITIVVGSIIVLFDLITWFTYMSNYLQYGFSSETIDTINLFTILANFTLIIFGLFKYLVFGLNTFTNDSVPEKKTVAVEEKVVEHEYTNAFGDSVLEDQYLDTEKDDVQIYEEKTPNRTINIGSYNTIEEKLRALKNLYEKGLIEEVDYQNEKQKLLEQL